MTILIYCLSDEENMTELDAINILVSSGATQSMARDVCGYIKKHPHIWKAFQEHCLKVVQQGARRLSAKATFEHMRYENSGGDWEKYKDYKVSNNYTAYFARLFAGKYPQYESLFLFKEIKGIKGNI